MSEERVLSVYESFLIAIFFIFFAVFAYLSINWYFEEEPELPKTYRKLCIDNMVFYQNSINGNIVEMKTESGLPRSCTIREK